MTCDGYDLHAERAVLGALVRGSLTLRDEGDLDVGDLHPRHQALADLLLAALDLHGRIDLALVLRVGAAAHVEPLGGFFEVRFAGGRIERHALGYLPSIARRAPARREALQALRAVAIAAEDRRVAISARARRERSQEAAALRRALDAYLDGDGAAALRDVTRAERLIVGVSGRELAQLAGSGR